MHTSYLYVPGNRPELFAKAMESGADVVVFDLEDAVAKEAKADARRFVQEAIADREAMDFPPELHVRVNSPGSGLCDDDLRSVVGVGLQGIRIPKVEDPDHIRVVDNLVSELLADRGTPKECVGLYPLVESARGLSRVGDLAESSDRIVRFGFGATDYLADLSAGEPAADHARKVLAVASKALGVGPPIDSVHTHVEDTDGLHAACVFAREVGMFGKSVIHPRQLDIVRAAFRPDLAEIDWALGVMEGWARAQAEGRAALNVGGQFVDPGVVARARSILELNEAAGP